MDHDMPTPNIHKFHSWMYTLFYPAVLGSMLVAVIFHSAGTAVWYQDFPVQFAIFLIAYFSAQHLQNVDNQQKYSYPRLLFDLVELGLMLPLFVLLGMTGPDLPAAPATAVDWPCFYALLLLAFLAPVGSRAWENRYNPFKPDAGRGLSVLSCLAAAGALAGIWLGASGLLLVFLSAVLLVYFLVFVFA